MGTYINNAYTTPLAVVFSFHFKAKKNIPKSAIKLNDMMGDW
jgi:hypothetical protein